MDNHAGPSQTINSTPATARDYDTPSNQATALNPTTERFSKRRRVEVANIEPLYQDPTWEARLSEEAKRIYNNNRYYIGNYCLRSRFQDLFNFSLHHITNTMLKEFYNRIYHTRTNGFKLSISFGYLLQNKLTHEVAYYWPSLNNQNLFHAPQLIQSSRDHENFLTKLDEVNLDIIFTRPDTQWQLLAITNVAFFIVAVIGQPIGHPPLDFPNHLLNNRGLFSLLKYRGQRYKDDLCVFRALALHRGASRNSLENQAKTLFTEYCTATATPENAFDGLTLASMEAFSRIFGCGVRVYSQDTPQNTQLVWRSIGATDMLNLNLHQNHFSYIKDLNKFSSFYRCETCDFIFKHHGNFARHLKTCKVGIRTSYKGGCFTIKPTLFERLAEEEGVVVPEDLRYSQYFSTWDIETLQAPENIQTKRTSFFRKHELVSIGNCSNIPGFQEPVCFIQQTGEPSIIDQFHDYHLQLSAAKYELVQPIYAEYLEQVQDASLKAAFEQFLKQLNIISFNGGNYDLNVIKDHLIPLLLTKSTINFVIKKSANNYLCISTPELKFLDVSNYIHAGCSYSAFLAAWGTDEGKSFFPYEWLDSFEKLTLREFPPYNAFFSSVRGKNTLEEDGGEVTGLENYHTLRQLFEDNNWSIADWLEYYNNADVKPFVTALEQLCGYYKQRGVCMFTDAYSAPGVAERIAFSSLKPEEQEFFTLFNRAHGDLVDLFLSNNTGGPSIIFDRYQEKGKTTINHKDGGKLCAGCFGWDANSLYLKAMSEFMPCGMFIRRRSSKMIGDHLSTNLPFIREYPSVFSKAATDWLAWVEHSEGLTIRHARNGGEYKVTSKIWVDGFCKDTNTVYQFHGCRWHGCRSCFKDVDRTAGDPSLDTKFENTERITKIISDLGYNIEVMWECAWRRKCVKDRVVIPNTYYYPTEGEYRMSEERVIRYIKTGKIFGAAEVDIHVPDHLKEAFQEFPPIFKNTSVTVDDIGDHMREFCEDQTNNCSFKGERRYLISSQFAKKQLFLTPLLMWYVDHGLIITKVYQIIEFNPKKCFTRFADQVTRDRRAGDADPALKVIGDTSKLVGNSVYGRSIMNRAKHTDTKFCDFEKAKLLVNDPRFNAIDELTPTAFEVDMKKKSIRHDLVVQIGFATYQYAKLKLLQFYYDFLRKFIELEDFCLIECDTDSLYMSLSGTTIDSVVKPELREEFERVKGDWMVRDDTVAHTRHDSRVPGLFKLEWSGDGVIALNSKTYYCFGTKDKISAKGVSQNNNDLTKQIFKDVLDSHNPHTVRNVGFRVRDDGMHTYAVEKVGLSYFYGKRQVHPNGVSTSPLDI